MSRALAQLVLFALVAGCGPPPTRTERTVYAPPREQRAHRAGPAAHEGGPATSGQAPTVLSAALEALWLDPLRQRELSPLAKGFTEDCELTPVNKTATADQAVRVGRAQLVGWLQGHLLTLPYADVRPVYLGPSAREGIDLAAVELLDGCGQVLAKVTAKLRQGPAGYEAVEVRLSQMAPPAAACPP